MFVKIDGEDLARNVFRRAQNYINSEGGERKIKGVIKNWDNNIFKRNFQQENTNCIFFQFHVIHFGLFASYSVG